MHGTLYAVRRMTKPDIDWAVELASSYYEGRFNRDAVRAWGYARLAEPGMVFLRNEHAFGVAHLSERYIAPGHQQAYLTLLYAEPNTNGRAVLAIINALREWAVEKQATKFWFGDVTGHDMGKLATVIGGRLAGHTYVVDLDNDPNALG